MIPKIIHYCWFGNGELPQLTVDCIQSWEKYLPDYQIKVWNEQNFDINQFQFAKEAYAERKFAFVSDVCRLYALKTEGGIYLDTDVEFLKPLTDEMLSKRAFTGFEDNLLLSSAIMGSEKEGDWIDDLLSYYHNRSFYLQDGSLDTLPNTEIITNFMKSKRAMLVNNTFQDLPNYCSIYPSDYFCPKSWKTLKVNVTSNTFCIHHFAGSWLNEEMSLFGKAFNRLFGKRTSDYLAGIYRNMKTK
jgi:mannosyltransferase OCH1-like enzyme